MWVESNRTRWNGFKLKEGRFKLDASDVRRKFFTGSCEVLEQAAQRNCGCSIPGGVQNQVGWGPGQPVLVPNLKAGGLAGGKSIGTQ